ncbi:MAG TPA: DUF721 domain-containing protein [Actinomycetota bacterium]|nr:DUF721 domain-containing protein [Actinomycetota bacterium]
MQSDGPGKRKAVPNAERTSDAQGLGAVLDGLLRGRPWKAGLAVGGLARQWPSVVGERLAEESRPAGLEAGVLTIKVSSAAWATQIGFLAEEVARRANEVIGAVVVGSVRVLVDPDQGGRSGDVGGSR